MTTSEHELLQSLFDSAVQLNGAQQETFLFQACADHPSLCTRLKRLLAASKSSDEIFNKFALEIFEQNFGADKDALGETIDVTPIPEGQLAPGTLLGNRYEIYKFLAQGGIGAAYLAVDRRLSDTRSDKFVVIKILREESLSNPYLKKKFEHERKALARIEHRRVVGLLDLGETSDGNSFFVMQYVLGTDLGAKINPSGMNFLDAANILKQIGQGLAAAHDVGILHRDLKPSNIRLSMNDDGKEEVTLIDFGIAQIADAPDATGTHTRLSFSVGTPAYMSPEQFAHDLLTPASDVYAMGILAYEMLTGRRPFHRLETQRDRPRLMPREIRPEIPVGAESAMLKAMALDPTQRYNSAKDFGDEIAHQLSITSADAQPVTTDEFKAPAKNKSRFLLIGALALILFVGVVGTVIFLSRNRDAQVKVTPQSERTLNYWIEVQKYRNDDKYEDPFRLASESIVFERDYRIRLHISSPQSGYLYIINESPLANNATPNYAVIFPDPSQNSGSAQLSVDQSIVVPGKGPIIFDNEKGTEKLWLIFSVRSLPEFEAVKGTLNYDDGGLVTNPLQIDAIKNFISKNEAPMPQSIVDNEGKQTIIRGSGDLLVSVRKFEHY